MDNKYNKYNKNNNDNDNLQCVEDVAINILEQRQLLLGVGIPETCCKFSRLATRHADKNVH